MANEARARIIIEAQGQQAVKELQKLGKEMGAVEKATKGSADAAKKQSGVLEKAQANWRGIAAGLGIATAALYAAKKAFDFGAEGAAMMRLEESGRNLAKTFGASMDEIVASVEKASLGTVSRNNIILASNKAMMLGVASSADDMGNLMQVAAFRARAMGLSTTQAFNDIVTGIGRMSPMILDNLGIVTGGVKTFDAYAESIGKTTAELTDVEKKQALLKKVFSETLPMIKEAGGLTADLATEYEVATTEIQNTTDALKQWVGVALGRALMAQRILRTSGDLTTEALSKTTEEVIHSDLAYKDYENVIRDFADTTGRAIITLDEFNEGIELSSYRGGAARESIVLLTVSERENERQAKKLFEKNMALAKSFDDLVDDEIITNMDLFTGSAAGASKEILTLEERLEEIATLAKGKLETFEYVSGVGLGEGLEDAAEKVREIEEEMVLAVDRIKELEGMRWLDPKQKEELGTLREELGELRSSVDEEAKAWKKSSAELVYNMTVRAMQTAPIEKQLELLPNLAWSLGLVDQEAYKAWQTLNLDLVNEDWDNMAATALALAEAYGAIPDQKIIDFRVNYTVSGGEAVREKWLQGGGYVPPPIKEGVIKPNQFGGKLGDITEVGEAGSEGIIGNTVIPHADWMRLKRYGVTPKRQMAIGGDLGDYDLSRFHPEDLYVAPTVPTATTTPTPTTQSVVSQSVNAVSQQAAAQSEFTSEIVGTINTQVSEQRRGTKVQGEKLDEVINELRSTREALPKQIRDAVLMETG